MEIHGPDSVRADHALTQAWIREQADRDGYDVVHTGVRSFVLVERAPDLDVDASDVQPERLDVEVEPREVVMARHPSAWNRPRLAGETTGLDLGADCG